MEFLDYKCTNSDTCHGVTISIEILCHFGVQLLYNSCVGFSGGFIYFNI